MFGKKIVVSEGSKRSVSYPAADGVLALAQAVGVKFDSERGYLRASGRLLPIHAPIYKDGVPLVYVDHFTNGTPVEYPQSVPFAVEDAIAAIALALGLEFRAEYVVGSAKPQLKAVKKPKEK